MKPLVALALTKGHVERVEVEGGVEDVGRSEATPEIGSAAQVGHQGSDDLAVLGIGELGSLGGDFDIGPGGGVVGHCKPPPADIR